MQDVFILLMFVDVTIEDADGSAVRMELQTVPS
jgi:predicted amino acid-binding ACT domain protein